MSTPLDVFLESLVLAHGCEPLLSPNHLLWLYKYSCFHQWVSLSPTISEVRDMYCRSVPRFGSCRGSVRFVLVLRFVGYGSCRLGSCGSIPIALIIPIRNPNPIIQSHKIHNPNPQPLALNLAMGNGPSRETHFERICRPEMGSFSTKVQEEDLLRHVPEGAMVMSRDMGIFRWTKQTFSKIFKDYHGKLRIQQKHGGMHSFFKWEKRKMGDVISKGDRPTNGCGGIFFNRNGV